ncbi:hypothetical protein [Stenotrophomonas acidaminiphila]|jgi:hypothetical protein
MTHALRSFLEPMGVCEIFADAPLDFSLLNRVWNGGDRASSEPPFRTKLAREGDLMSRVEYKQPSNWTASPTELATAASQLDTWHCTDVRFRPEADIDQRLN